VVHNYFKKGPANWAYSLKRMPPTPNSSLIEPSANDLKYICESRSKEDKLEELIRELRQRVKGIVCHYCIQIWIGSKGDTHFFAKKFPYFRFIYSNHFYIYTYDLFISRKHVLQ